MTTKQFHIRREIIGWIWLIFGVGCALLQPWEIRFDSLGAGLALVMSLIYLGTSLMNKLMRITRRYSENFIFLSIISGVLTTFCLSFQTAKLTMNTTTTDSASPIFTAIWLLGWFVVDLIDLWNAPEEAGHTLRH